MGKAILLSDLLRLIPDGTEIILANQVYIHLCYTKNREILNKYGDCPILNVDSWNDTAIYVRIINE